MPSALLWAYSAEKLFIISQIWKICGFSRFAFSREGFGDELPQTKPDGFASSLWEGASGAPGNFALEPETMSPCQRPHLRGGWHRAQRDDWGSFRPKSHVLGRKSQTFKQSAQKDGTKFGGSAFDRSREKSKEKLLNKLKRNDAAKRGFVQTNKISAHILFDMGTIPKKY